MDACTNPPRSGAPKRLVLILTLAASSGSVSWGQESVPGQTEPTPKFIIVTREDAALRSRDLDRAYAVEVLKPGYMTDAGAPITENVDYWKLPEIIPGGTFKAEKSYMLVLTGCVADVADNAKCGDGHPGNASPPGPGNLKVTIFELDRSTAVPATSMGAQFVHASPSFDKVNPGAGIQPVVPALLDPADAGAAVLLNGMNPVAYLKGTALVQAGGPVRPLIISNPTADPQEFAFPLSAAAQLSGVAGGYVQGKAYTFVLVGDKDVPLLLPDGGINSTNGYHFLGFQNDPPVVPFDPNP